MQLLYNVNATLTHTLLLDRHESTKVWVHHPLSLRCSCQWLHSCCSLYHLHHSSGGHLRAEPWASSSASWDAFLYNSSGELSGSVCCCLYDYTRGWIPLSLISVSMLHNVLIYCCRTFSITLLGHNAYVSRIFYWVVPFKLSIFQFCNNFCFCICTPPHTSTQRVITYSRLIFTGQLNWAAVITSIVCILILIGLDFINSLLRKHVRVIPLHIPAQLVVVSPYKLLSVKC